jgi:hypothetical protein
MISNIYNTPVPSANFACAWALRESDGKRQSVVAEKDAGLRTGTRKTPVGTETSGEYKRRFLYFFATG